RKHNIKTTTRDAVDILFFFMVYFTAFLKALLNVVWLSQMGESSKHWGQLSCIHVCFDNPVLLRHFCSQSSQLIYIHPTKYLLTEFSTSEISRNRVITGRFFVFSSSIQS